MKRVLVTGGAGFIGLNLVRELINQDYEVSVLIEKNDEKGKASLKTISSRIVIYDDLERLISESSTISPFDVIFNLATVGVSPMFDDIELICDVNIKLGCKLVKFAKSNNSGLFVNFGSCFEYGDHGDMLLEETFDCKPESLYAISKNAATSLISHYAKALGVAMITVRPFGVFGYGEGINRLAPSIIRSCIEGKQIKTTEGKQIRDFVDVKDLAKAIILLTNSKYEKYETYNVCSDTPIAVKDFILEIVNTCGFDSSLIEFGALPYRKNEAMVFAGSNKKIQNVINYSFPKNHKSGILDIYNSLKNSEE